MFYRSFLLLGCWFTTAAHAFVGVVNPSCTVPTSRPVLVSALQMSSSPPVDEATARVITEYMAKAHEEKIRALAELELEYKAQIEQLQQQQLDNDDSASTTDDDDDTSASTIFSPPVTNKALTEKIEAYRNFISRYIVNAQLEKAKAVAEAERKVREHYEELLAEHQEA